MWEQSRSIHFSRPSYPMAAAGASLDQRLPKPFPPTRLSTTNRPLITLTTDNGLLGLLAAEHPPTKIICFENPECWLPEVTATFHGRDVMAPVAARLGSGLPPERLGLPTERLTQLDWPEVCRMSQSVEGEVVTVDSFGNLITNITRGMLVDVPTDDSVVIRCDGHETRGLFSTYGDQPPMTLLALFSSSGNLELAVVDDNAAAMLGARVGTKVIVAW